MVESIILCFVYFWSCGTLNYFGARLRGASKALGILTLIRMAMLIAYDAMQYVVAIIAGNPNRNYLQLENIFA